MNKFIKLNCQRIIRVLGRMLYRKHIWLVSDRPWAAGDNGEAFYRFLQTKPVNTIFAVSSSSKSYEELKQIGKVIEYDSVKHKLLMCMADVNISSHDRHLRGHSETPQVFLSHGISNRDLHEYYNRMNHKNLYTIVCSEAEKERLTTPPFELKPEQVFLTGYPRYDYLYGGRTERIITIAFTWRSFLWGKEKEDFLQSEYYRVYTSFFDRSDFIEKINEYGYSLKVKLHPELEKFKDVIKLPQLVSFWDDVAYREIFQRSALIITDYSSAIYDMAYLKKPVLYYQPDYEVILESGSVGAQYVFDYEDKGVGDVTKTIEELETCVESYLKTGCEMKAVYRDRVDSFFAYNDKRNCERVYSMVCDILKTKTNKAR